MSFYGLIPWNILSLSIYLVSVTKTKSSQSCCFIVIWDVKYCQCDSLQNLPMTTVRFGVLRCAWWRHQMKAFSALLAICAGNSPVTGEFPAQRTVTRSFDVFFYLRLNKPLSKQWWGWWFETLTRPLWRHCNGLIAWEPRHLSHWSYVYLRMETLVNRTISRGLRQYPTLRKIVPLLAPFEQHFIDT